MDTQSMSVMDHIVELRRRIVIAFVFFALAFIIGFFLATPLITYLTNAPMAQDLPMNAFKLTDPFRIFMTMATIIAFVMIWVIEMFWGKHSRKGGHSISGKLDETSY